MRRLAVLVVVTGLVACQRTDGKQIAGNAKGAGSGSGSAIVTNVPKTRTQGEQVKPPLDLMNPPMDALKTSSGLIYKRLSGAGDSPKPLRNDTVMVTYTGWRQTGETFFTNKGKGQPQPLQLANLAPGFTEALLLMHKGESAMLWIPPAIGYKGAPPPGSSPETLVYEVELLDIVAAPVVPADLTAPATALKLPATGLAYVVAKPGTGKDKARYFDTVTFNYTAWDSTGRMFDSTEMRKRPATVPPFRQTAAMEDILTAMTAGERIRVWIPAEKMQQGGKPLPGMPQGILTYEVEMISITKGTQPPPKPADVAAVPADAKKTAKGVAYKVLHAGKGGPHPTPTDTVKVNYTGWSTDGRMFDSSVIKNEPAEFSLGGVIIGWTEGIPLMSVGDRFRFWIPEELAFKGAPGRPQGQLVFDIELLEIKPPVKVEANDPAAQAAPPDVAAPPADAKKTAKGVFYKILKAVPGSPHPTLSDSVKIEFSGWTTDGKPFDSSKSKGRPYETRMQDVIVGWQEGVAMVGVGESARLWIPAELAYPNGGGPQGMLVFDIDLLEIKK